MYGGYKSQREFIRAAAESFMTEEQIAERVARRKAKNQRKYARAKELAAEKKLIEQSGNPTPISGTGPAKK